MTETTEPALLHGLRVIDLGDDSTRMAGRILADLGANVLRVATPDATTPRTLTAADRSALREYCWSLGTTRLTVDSIEDPNVRELLMSSNLVVVSGQSAALQPTLAPQAVWLSVTPFGPSGPRSGWRASDLGVMASSGNLYLSGYPDRPPVMCVEPISDAHVGVEAVLAALIALSRGGARVVDLSAQESIVMANMGLADRARTTGLVLRRDGGRRGNGTTQVWTCRDGYVVLGLGGGPARQPTMDRLFELMAEDGIKSDDLSAEPWSIQRWMAYPLEEQNEITDRIARFFAGRSARELQDIAYAERLMMAAVHSSAEVKASEQLVTREYFMPVPDPDAQPGNVPAIPARFARIIDRDGWTGLSPRPGGPQRQVTPESALAEFAGRDTSVPLGSVLDWSKLSFLEFGSSAAGPFTGRMFAEHGATVVRIESHTKPDFLRVISTTKDYGLDAAPMFDSINAGKLSIAIDMTRAEGRDIARRLCCAFDVVSENFSPKTMRKLGLDYPALVEHRPDLIMLSSCLNGQTGPNQFFPGFGGQGSALCGYTYLTGFPDRAPLGPAQAITDSISPRFAALLLVALLLRRARTGTGAYVDLSQVEATGWTLSPWFLAEDLLERDITRYGNRLRDLAAVPYGIFPCTGNDRWVAIAVRSDEEWARLVPRLDTCRPEWSSLGGRQRDIDAVEEAVAAWTVRHAPPQCASLLQGLGIEAVPVADGTDNMLDPQLTARAHYQVMQHPTLGECWYERSGYRISGDADGYRRPSPLVGEHTDLVLGEFLGLGSADITALRDSGIVG